MKTVKLCANKIEGCVVVVDIKGDTTDYARAFLHIFNNVRENPELFGVENLSASNLVFVYGKAEAKEAIIDYLENFGDVVNSESALILQTEDFPDYDYDKYEFAYLAARSE